jgi:hypothetical protein
MKKSRHTQRHQLLELAEQCVDIFLAGEADHDLELLNLDVGRVIVLAEEDAHLVLKKVRSLLKEEVDVAKGDPLDLRGRGYHSHCTCRGERST